MSNQVDLDARLRTAGTGTPDTERALRLVMRGVHRRRMWKGASAIAASMVLILSAVWIIDRGSPTEPTVHSGRPPTTTTVPDIRVRPSWTAQDAVVFGRFLTVNGRLLDADARSVYVASGLTDPGTIAALDPHTGRPQWTRSLTTPGGAAIQGVADQVVIANSYDELIGMDASTGETRWTISLASLDLQGYWPTRSAIVDGISAIGLSTNGEGDSRAPVVLGLRNATGKVVWRTKLGDETDLTWAVPPVVDNTTIFLSTPSGGPTGSNQAHMLDLADGSVVWSVDLGGSQGFSTRRPVFFGASAALPTSTGDGEVRTFDRASGTERWSVPGLSAVATADGLWTLLLDRSLVLFDPASGTAVRTTGGPVAALGVPQLLDLGSGFVGVASFNELKVLSGQGLVVLTQALGGRIEEIAHVGDTLYVATADNKVTAYQITGLPEHSR